jgi:hypothetical protein
MRNVSNISAARRLEDAKNRAACPPPIWSPPANPKRFGNGTTIKCGVAIPDSRPQPTVKMQSTCRGEFPRVQMTQRPLVIPIEGRKMVDSMIALLKCWQRGGDTAKLRKSADKAIDTYYAWAYKEALKNEPVSTGAREVVSPLPSGGPNAPAPEQSLRAGVSGCARVSGNGSGVDRVPGLPVSEPHHAPAGGNGTTCPHIEERHKLNGAIENGDVTYIHPAPVARIMSAIAEETPRQRMAKAITAAVARIPESWDDHDTIKLPYGFYLKRKGFNEAKIYHPKHQGNSIPAALYLPPWTVISPHKLRNSLDIIEGIIKRYRLAEEPEPTNPASKAA